MFRKLIVASGLAAAFTFAGSAMALTFTFDSVGDTLLTTYSFTQDGADVTATVEYELTSISSTEAEFDVTIINSTALAQPGVNRLTAFGVDIVSGSITAAATSNSSPTAGEWDATVDTNFPSFQQVNLCSYAGPNCSGGSSLGVAEQETDLFDLLLTGTFGTTPSISFTSPFPAKFQAVGTAGGSFEVDACEDDNCPDPTPDPTVPEPGTLALIAIGILGLVASTRRRTTRTLTSA